MKVASVHQSAQSYPSTESASCFCSKVQIPQILRNKMASVHCWKLRGLEGWWLLHSLMGRVSILQNCDLGIYFYYLKKRFNYANIHLNSTKLNWMLNQTVHERQLKVASISKFFSPHHWKSTDNFKLSIHWAEWCHRTIEPCRMEKTLKVFNSNP